jgi:hypothetical protein
MNEFFGLGWSNVFLILAAVAVVAIYVYPIIQQRLGKYKVDVGKAYFHFWGKDGIAYMNEKVLDYKKNPFGGYTFSLSSGITLTNVNVNENSEDCNAIVLHTVSALGGVVDVACNIDAMNKKCVWNSRFNENWGKIREDIKSEMGLKVKKEILENKEFKDTFNDTNIGFSSFNRFGGGQQ